MLRVDEHQVKLQQLSIVDQTILLNSIFAVAHMRLSDAANAMRTRLEPLGWYVFEGGHHISVGKKGDEPNAPIKLFDVEDPYLSMVGFPDYLCEERRSVGLSLIGNGS